MALMEQTYWTAIVVLLPIFVTGQGEVVNSRIVAEPTLLYFHFYLCGR